MFPIAHHIAVELFGREYLPRTPLEHVIAFVAVRAVLALAGYGAWALSAKWFGRSGTRKGA